MEKNAKIAYFSMEVGLQEDIPTYCGGLGVLAGDTLRSCADFGVHVVGVTLLSEKGFFKQSIDENGVQREEDFEWDPNDHLKVLPKKTSIRIEGREVWVRAWMHNIEGIGGYLVPVLFLDTNLPENNEEDRKITWHLYGGDDSYRLKQEAVLGIGGVRILQTLGYEIEKYHMNEGHSSMLALELLKQEIAKNAGFEPALAQKVKDKCIFTTHTPIPAGHDKFPYFLVEKTLKGEIDMDVMKKYGGDGHLNMTLLGFNFSRYINGVAKKHSEVSRGMFPGYEVYSITNGIHPATWTSPPFRQLYDKYIKDWRKDPFLFRYLITIPDEEVWEAHMQAKKEFLAYVKEKTGAELGEDTLTVGFARRMTEYKRPTLLFSDLARLRKIASEKGGLQVVYSGKAHPKDTRGKELIKKVGQYIEELRGQIEVVYIEDYDIGVAKKMVSGVDLWLNTPEKPKEASGTSGMKATLNGVLNLSVLDGWWVEGCIEGKTGWCIGGMETETYTHYRCVRDLYDKLEEITDMFYRDRKKWVDIMKTAISLNASFFNSHRMIQQYVMNAYMD